MSELLAFEDVKECRGFIKEEGGILSKDKKELMLKKSQKIFENHHLNRKSF